MGGEEVPIGDVSGRAPPLSVLGFLIGGAFGRSACRHLWDFHFAEVTENPLLPAYPNAPLIGVSNIPIGGVGRVLHGAP